MKRRIDFWRIAAFSHQSAKKQKSFCFFFVRQKKSICLPKKNQKMRTGKFVISSLASAQMALLPRGENAALSRLFSSDQINQPATTKAGNDGRFVSRLGSKLLPWRWSAQLKPEIPCIVDQSFARRE